MSRTERVGRLTGQPRPVLINQDDRRAFEGWLYMSVGSQFLLLTSHYGYQGHDAPYRSECYDHYQHRIFSQNINNSTF
jgi:hypothetical protein